MGKGIIILCVTFRYIHARNDKRVQEIYWIQGNVNSLEICLFTHKLLWSNKNAATWIWIFIYIGNINWIINLVQTIRYQMDFLVFGFFYLLPKFLSLWPSWIENLNQMNGIWICKRPIFHIRSGNISWWFSILSSLRIIFALQSSQNTFYP